MAYVAKTTANTKPVVDFLKTLQSEERQADAFRLLEIFEEVTGEPPVMWGSAIIGFGSYDYRYDSGHSGTYFRTGFSPRKNAFSIYIMPGYQDFGPLLDRLGKHTIGKSCLHIKRLSDIDLTVLKKLIRQGLNEMETRYPSN